MAFQPTVGQELLVRGVRYRIAEHPAAPGMPYGQEGRQAVVYQLVADSEQRALKVFKPRFRLPALAGLAPRLARLAALPGLAVCERTVLTPQQHGALLREYPELTYAVLMPWVAGPTWMELLLEPHAMLPEESAALAGGLAALLAAMEQRGLAHCDLSGPNVLLPALADSSFGTPHSAIELVDVEQMFGPGLERPEILAVGSPGYASHRTSGTGLWESKADRFAGAVLLAEMLGWCDPAVREAAWGETYFAPNEMQQPGVRYDTLLAGLRVHWGHGVAGLLSRAWTSEILADCPTFGEWQLQLPAAPGPEPGHRAGTEHEAATSAHLERAREFELQGNVAGALESYHRILALAAPDSPLAGEVRMVVAELEARKRAPAPRPSGAVAASPTIHSAPTAAFTVTPGRPDLAPLFNTALVAYGQNEWARARELFTAVVREDPEYSRDGLHASTLLADVTQRMTRSGAAGRRWPAWVGIAALLLPLVLAGGAGVLVLGAAQQETGRAALAAASATAQTASTAAAQSTAQEAGTVAAQATLTVAQTAAAAATEAAAADQVRATALAQARATLAAESEATSVVQQAAVAAAQATASMVIAQLTASAQATTVIQRVQQTANAAAQATSEAYTTVIVAQAQQTAAAAMQATQMAREAAQLTQAAAVGTVRTVSVVSTPTVPIDARPWPRYQRGDTGTEIAALQFLLVAQGYPLQVDEVFGPETESQVRGFQDARGLVVDGIVGPHTWAQLIVKVQAGAQGPAVQAVQYLLEHKYGFSSLRATGDFDGAVDAAVRSFQQDHGLGVDGMVGPTTWFRLVSGND